MLEGKTELPTVDAMCSGCHFWLKTGSQHGRTVGLCRRHPKTEKKASYDWCGEWRAKMEETAETPQQSRKQKKLERLIAQIPQATVYILWQIVHDTTREPALREAAFRELVARKSPPPA